MILDDKGSEFTSPCSKIGDKTPAGDKQNRHILAVLNKMSGFVSIFPSAVSMFRHVLKIPINYKLFARYKR